VNRLFEFPFPGSLISTFLVIFLCITISGASASPRAPRTCQGGAEREFFIDNLLVRIHFIIVMIRWTGLAPWEFGFPFPGSLTSTFLEGGTCSPCTPTSKLDPKLEALQPENSTTTSSSQPEVRARSLVSAENVRKGGQSFEQSGSAIVPKVWTRKLTIHSTHQELTLVLKFETNPRTQTCRHLTTNTQHPLLKHNA